MRYLTFAVEVPAGAGIFLVPVPASRPTYLRVVSCPSLLWFQVGRYLPTYYLPTLVPTPCLAQVPMALYIEVGRWTCACVSRRCCGRLESPLKAVRLWVAGYGVLCRTGRTGGRYPRCISLSCEYAVTGEQDTLALRDGLHSGKDGGPRRW